MPEKIIVSFSELDTFRQCPLKHHLGYKQRWTKPVDEDSALGRGTLWHKVMEEHYRTIRDYQEAMQTERGTWILPAEIEDEVLEKCWVAVSPLLADTTSGVQSETQELVEWMYRGHVEMWGIDRDWKILGVEHTPLVPLRNEAGRRTRYWLKMKIDLMVKDRRTGKISVVDHKSAKDLTRKVELDIDDQFGLYTWGMRELGVAVFSSIHSAARTYRLKTKEAPLDERFARTPMYRTDKELHNLALDAYRAAHAAYPPGNQKVPYSAPNPSQCGWKCEFRDAHLMMRKGMNPTRVLMDLGFRVNKERH